MKLGFLLGTSFLLLSAAGELTPNISSTMIDQTPTRRRRRIHAGVTLTRGTATMVHTPYHENQKTHALIDDPTWYYGSRPQKTSFKTYVIENGLVKVTVVPGFGGRILSIFYKPTQQEMLYQNPLAVPYGWNAGQFYINWNMVWGGIFPTFPTPEHGKTWNLPYDAVVVNETSEEVVISMSHLDDLDPAKLHYSVPKEFRPYAKSSGLKLTVMVRVQRSSAAVGFEVKLENPNDRTVDYEYWTCTSLAPGSAKGTPRGVPLNTEIVAPTDEVYVPEWCEPAVQKAESATNEVCRETGQGAEKFGVYKFDKLRKFSNWRDWAILYAYDKNGRGGMKKDYWGAINHDNGAGIFRVADHKKTPGLKFWTWGRNSIHSDPRKPDAQRPFIELWGGHSNNFFNRVQIASGEAKHWTETYYSTIGLSKITHMNDLVAAEISHPKANFTARLFTHDYTKDALTVRLQKGALQPWRPSTRWPTVFTTPKVCGEDFSVEVFRGKKVVFEVFSVGDPCIV